MTALVWIASAAMALALAAEPTAEFLKLPAHDVERIGTSEKVRVGDAIDLRVPGPKDAGLRAAQESEPLVEQGWELIPQASTTPDEIRFKAVPLKPGKLTLPALAVVQNGGAVIGRTQPFSIEVDSAILPNDPKPQESAALQPPVGLRFPWWVLAAGAVLLLVLLATLFYAYKRWRKKQPKAVAVEPVSPPLPEDVVALEALEVLEKSGVLLRGEFKKHYFGISEILKAYIGGRYRFDASESTTREMISALEEKRSLNDRELDALELLFEKLDLVKFTDHIPMSEEGLRLLEAAREFVRTTRRPPAVPAVPSTPEEISK